MEGSVLLYGGSVDTDMEQLMTALVVWLRDNRAHLGDGGPQLIIDHESLWDAYNEDIYVLMNVFGRESNAMKRAATIMFALCRCLPLGLTQAGAKKLHDEDQRDRYLQLVNAKAAYEIAETYARSNQHGYPNGEHFWQFENRAMFPSLHSFSDFMQGMTRVSHDRVRDVCVEVKDLMVTRIALILELCFYRKNGGIAGRSDKDFYQMMLEQHGYAEFIFLNLTRNADDVNDWKKPKTA